MFPLNLQRNIVQLDKQISLLENECKNMEMEKKKKSHKLEPTYSSCSRNLNTRLKAPTVRVTTKKTDSSKRNKKPTPVSSRLQSTGSLPSHCSKAWCENGDGRNSKFSGLNTNASAYSCQTLGSPQCNLRRESKCVKCVCCNEASVSDIGNVDPCERNKKDHVLVFPNASGTIEVTVTQKPNHGKENSPIRHRSPRKATNFEKDNEKDLEGCKCQIKGQKWSEILCVDSSRKKQSNIDNYVKNKNPADEAKVIHQSQNFNGRKFQENLSNINQNNSSLIQEQTFEVPVKLSPQFFQTKKPEVNSNKFEKQTQCSIENNSNHGEFTKEFKDPVKVFQLLFHRFQQISNEDLKKSFLNKDSVTEVEDSNNKDSEAGKNNSASSADSKSNVSYINAVKHHCENLMGEKASLTEELLAKGNEIALMKKREEEYLSVIAKLKSNLERTKESAQQCTDAVKELNIFKAKLMEQTKVSEALKKKLQKYHDTEHERILENAKLKTELKILQLESQKHEILLAGKEAQIKRYKEEIENFQRQISDHLSSLKSNAQVSDVEKMVEAIMQQSQVFAQTELESLLERDENDEKDSSRIQNALMHSSPTSAKTSVVNSSWKQISSIHEHSQSKAPSEVIYLNDEKNENFFEAFGGKPVSEVELPEKGKETSSEKLLEKREVKNSSSFTSCVSLHEQITSKSTSQDSLISRETPISNDDTDEELRRENSGVSLDRAQKNIEELLKNMKLKFSKEIFDTSLPSCVTEDYLDVSQISSISPL